MEQNGFAGDIYEFGSGDELLAAFSPTAYDAVFLDIYMSGVSGIDTAKHIRAADPTCAIIFITTSRDHSLESYALRGSAYVVKPISDADMSSALFQCRDIFMRNARYIAVRVGRADMKIPLIKIYYVESKANYMFFRTAGGEYSARMTMDDAERRLGGKPFFRCHQSYIVNTNHIAKLSGNDVVMNNGDAVPMRKNGRDAVRAELTAMISGRMFEAY
jgi:DNA-binding LytR/AlgR family response regulator